jgi:hypothetical protein
MLIQNPIKHLNYMKTLLNYCKKYFNYWNTYLQKIK